MTPPTRPAPASEEPRPTLRDVAKLAGGVHPSTVSLAMRNHPGISEALRKRIKAAAKELGYRPDPLLDAFNHHRVAVQPHRSISTLAWVVELSSRSELLDHPYHGALWAGAQKAAEFYHCQLELFFLGGNQLSPSRLNTVLKARGITGLVCVEIKPERPSLDISWEWFSALRIGSDHLAAPAVGISPDHKQGVRLATGKLREAGAARIGLVISPHTNPSVAEAVRTAWAYERSQAASGAFPAAFLQGDATPFEIRKWARLSGLDSVILTDHRSLFPNGRLETREPAPLRIACLDAAAAPAWLPGCVVDPVALGNQAVEQAVTLLRNNQRGNPETTITTFLPMNWRAAGSAPSPLLT